jgi:hypothetical protein
VGFLEVCWHSRRPLGSLEESLPLCCRPCGLRASRGNSWGRSFHIAGPWGIRGDVEGFMQADPPLLQAPELSKGDKFPLGSNCEVLRVSSPLSVVQ